MPRGKLKSKDSIIHDDFYGESILTDVSTAPDKFSGYLIVAEPVEELGLKPGDELPFSEENFPDDLPLSKSLDDKNGAWVTFDVVEKEWFGKKQKVAARLRKSTTKEINDAHKRVLFAEKAAKERAKADAKAALKAAKQTKKESKAKPVKKAPAPAKVKAVKSAPKKAAKKAAPKAKPVKKATKPNAAKAKKVAPKKAVKKVAKPAPKKTAKKAVVKKSKPSPKKKKR